MTLAIIISIVVFVLLILVARAFSLRKVIKLFESGNVLTTGLRGTGKDLLNSNVVARRKQPYISNMDYKCKKSVFIPLDFNRLDPLNNYKNFVNNDIVHYEYPYPENCDIYVSDAGVYFPSQYCSELNKQYADMPIFQALSRHLGNCNFHVNVQNLNRVWDKIREQCDTYIRTLWAVFPFAKVPVLNMFPHLRNMVVQCYITYDNYDSCLSRVEPYVHLKTPFSLNAVARAEYKSKDLQAHRKFVEDHGHVRKHVAIYQNKSQYDSRLFKSLLSNGRSHEDKKQKNT